MTIELNQKTIQVEIMRKPNKNIYMRMASANVLTVSCNRLVSEKEIARILEKNKEALEKMQVKK